MSELINGKTPQEIKTWMEYCASHQCPGCPYDKKFCSTNMVIDAGRFLIERLEEQISLMKIQMKGDCGCCKHRNDERKIVDGQLGCRLSPVCYECLNKDGRPRWEYEGLPEVKSR